MRLLRIATNYSAYLNQFYTKNIELKNKTYAEQYQKLMADCYGWANFWTHAFGELGYKVWEIVGNAEPMQKKWASENGVKYDRERWLTDIISAQAKYFRPDVLFINDYCTYQKDFIHYLRSVCPSIQLTMGWCGSPFSDSDVFKAYDLVLSNIPGIVKCFTDEGHNCEHMHHAFEPKILNNLKPTQNKSVDFTFIGSIVKEQDFHKKREELLKELISHTELQIFSDIRDASTKELLLLPIKKTLYNFLQNIKSYSGFLIFLNSIPMLRRYIQMEYAPNLDHLIDKSITIHSRPALFGMSMFQKLFDSRISLNTHIDLSIEYASNMRLFETTGVGTCLLTEWQPNLHELFKPDTEVVTYKCANEAIEKVQYLLSHSDERQKIAQAGQRRTLKSHTFEIRAQLLNNLIQKNI